MLFNYRAIIRYLLLSGLCGFAVSVSHGSTDIHTEKNGDSQTVILVLGDSLSAGFELGAEPSWPSLLQKRLDQEKHHATVVNASISGETTGGGLSRLPELISDHAPDVILVELGANDGLRGFPLKVMKSHLSQIITLGQNNHSTLLLIGVQIPLNYGQRYTEQFEKTFVELAESHQVRLLPSLLGEIPLHAELMLEDGLHPNAQAQPLILDRVWPLIEPLLLQPGQYEN